MTNMKKLMTLVVCFLIVITGAFAQSADSTATSTSPQYSAGAFLGFNRYSSPQMKGGGFFDTRIADNTYSTNSLNMTSQSASVTTGVKRFFYSSANGTVSLYGNAAAGVATGSGSTTAVFAGGGGIKLMLEGASKKAPFLKLFSSIPGSYLAGGVDIQQITGGAGVSPTFTFAVGVDFR